MNLQSLRKHRDAILALALENKTKNIRVFGSVARGKATKKSDVDLLVHPASNASLFDLVGFEQAVSKLLGCKVDVLSDTAIKKEFAPYILKEAVPL
jgi:predicted nucleotidyltransferase